MRRVMVGLVLGAMLLMPVPVAAEDSPALQYATALSDSDMGAALGAWSQDITSISTRDRLRAAILRDRIALSGVVPDACTLPLYVGYLEVLTYADVALTLFEAMQFEAATAVQEMIAPHIESMDPTALSACL